MRPTRLAATALVLATAALLLVAAPAVAGGPTSVLLVAPGGGGTASLYYEDADYGELSRLVGAEGPGGSATAGSAGGHETGTSVTVTWLVHDVAVWRIDRVYLGAKGGPWLATQQGFGDDVLSSPVTWHRPAEPTSLVALLDRLGLQPGNGSSAVVPAPAPPAAEPAPAPTSQAAAPATPAGTPWRLLALAALAGALATAAAAVPLSRRAARPAGTDDRAGDDDMLTWPPAGDDTGERPVSAR